jgi:hypothetical protein
MSADVEPGADSFAFIAQLASQPRNPGVSGARCVTRLGGDCE